MAIITTANEFILIPWHLSILSWLFISFDLITNKTIGMIVFDTVIYAHLVSYILSFVFLILKIVNIKYKSEKIKKINRVLFWFFVFFISVIVIGIVCMFYGRELIKIFNPELYEKLERERIYYLESKGM